MAIFASTDDVQVLRLPFDAKERVVIADYFATRDLVRDMASAVHYYVVVLGRDHARLIEAANNRVIKEFDQDDEAQKNMESIPFLLKTTAYIKQVTVDQIVQRTTKTAI